MASLAERIRASMDELDLPPIGGGRTAERWAALIELAAADVDLARLAEAHVDAVEILREAGRAPEPGGLLGVWASEHPDLQVRVAERTSDHVVLQGAKGFCSGAGIVDEVLVTVTDADGPLLVRVPGSQLGADRIDDTGWKVPALRAVRTATVDLTGIVVPTAAVVGPPGWYLDRPGFWHGALGPAACWAGTAIGLVHLARARVGEDPHALAHLGALTAAERSLRALFAGAGAEMDAVAGTGRAADHRVRALEVRHLADAACGEIADRFARCLGPRALAFDGAAAERLQALGIYRRQSHGERDLATLGALVRRAST